MTSDHPAAGTVTAVEHAVHAVHALLGTRDGTRVLLGLAGPPGAGKSTFAAYLGAALDAAGTSTAVVPVDGFHLADAVLVSAGLRHRKGAPDTFDVDGFVALLHRLRAHAPHRTVYAPAFRRDLEEPVAGAVPVPSTVQVVLVEGNYLLHDRDGWEAVRPALHACWYLDAPDAVRRERLLRRALATYGTPAAAEQWVAGTDEPNAQLVAATRVRADRTVRLAAV